MPGLPLILEEDASLEQTKSPSVTPSSEISCPEQFLHHDTEPDDDRHYYEGSAKPQSGGNYFEKLSSKKNKVEEDPHSHPENGDSGTEMKILEEDENTTAATTAISSPPDVENSSSSSSSIGDNNNNSINNNNDNSNNNNIDEINSDELSSLHIDNWIEQIERANSVDTEVQDTNQPRGDTKQEAKDDPNSNSNPHPNQPKPSGGPLRRHHGQHRNNQSNQTRRPHSVQQVSSSTPSTAPDSKVRAHAGRPRPTQADPGERPLPQFSRSATVGVMESRASSRRSARGADQARDEDSGGASSALDLIHKYYHSMSQFSVHQAERKENEM
ncbi:hypothetical protein EGW08_014644 [Elysia chlorotica]|uniref:Uncharacterized protein n=1 Tax=Elysia chlorotica TaxID=188477 RepID=A0A433T7M1_ELYCH|nr:hypothetical protein EGW08_014644 [Elysia chlorotica]